MARTQSPRRSRAQPSSGSSNNRAADEKPVRSRGGPRSPRRDGPPHSLPFTNATGRVDDLVQDVWIAVLRALPRLNNPATLKRAWQYSIPPDASQAAVDWDRFLGARRSARSKPSASFAGGTTGIGTGVAGDLFGHLLSGLHAATRSIGPEPNPGDRGLRQQDDGRDVMLAMLDYPKQAARPEFIMGYLKSGVPAEEFGFRFMGSEGDTTSMSSAGARAGLLRVHVSAGGAKRVCPPVSREVSLGGGAPRIRSNPKASRPPRGTTRMAITIRVFYQAVRAKRRPVEEAAFGFRAAGPARLANVSCYEKRACKWDANSVTGGQLNYV